MATLLTGDIFRREGHLYNNEITIAFNDTAYNNEDLFETLIDEEYCPILTGHDNLLVMDMATFHKTPSILKKLRENHVMTAFIPSGYEFTSITRHCRQQAVQRVAARGS